MLPAECQPACKNCIKIHCDLNAFSNGVFFSSPACTECVFCRVHRGYVSPMLLQNIAASIYFISHISFLIREISNNGIW